MINLENLRHIIENECADEKRIMEKDIMLFKKIAEQETKRVRNECELKIRKREEEYGRCTERVHGTYSRPMAEDVLRSLEGDYNLMQTRSIILDISEKDLEQAIKCGEKLNRLKDEESRKILLETISEFNPSIREAVGILSDDFKKIGAVTSFTAAFFGGVYLLSPVRNHSDKKLVINLESKLQDVVCQGSVDTRDFRGLARKSSSDSGELIEFTPDYQIVNEFLIYLLKQDAGCNPANLEKGIARKLSDGNIQPDGFKQANLRHNVYAVPLEVINYFISHNPKEIICTERGIRKIAAVSESISYEDAAKLAGTEPKYIKKLATQGFFKKTGEGIEKSAFMNYVEGKKCMKKPTNTTARELPSAEKPGKRLHYTSTDSEEMKAEAYKRIEEVGGSGKFDRRQLNYILGFGKNSSSTNTRLSRCPELDSYVIREGRTGAKKPRVYLAVEGVKKYIDLRKLNRDGSRWIKIVQAE